MPRDPYPDKRTAERRARFDALTQTEQPHGTRARYVQGCRCDECRKANRKIYHERQARGEAIARELPWPADGKCPGWDDGRCGRKLRKDSLPLCRECRMKASANHLVDAGEARAHLEQLAAKGVGYKAVARKVGLATSVVSEIKLGKRPQIRRLTAEAILGVDNWTPGLKYSVPAGPTWKLIERLLTVYPSKRQLAKALGYGEKLQISTNRVHHATHERVRALYLEHFGDDSP